MEPFIGEIKLCAFAFPPKDWAFCNGAMVRVDQFPLLFSLLGTRYGGDGAVTFALPDLRGRVAVHRDADHPQGAMGGLEQVALSADQTPTHNHSFNVSSTPGIQISVGTDKDRVLAASQFYSSTATADGKPIYAGANNLVDLGGAMCDPVGAGTGHNNMQPSLVLNYVIALRGLYPSKV